MTGSQQFTLFELPQHINEPLYDITVVTMSSYYILHILLHYFILNVLHVLHVLLHVLLHYFILNVLHVLHVLLDINVTELPCN